MLKKYLCILLISLFSSMCLGQNKQDYIWYFGKDQDINTEGIQASQIDFNEIEIKPRLREGGLQFDQNNANICDKEGNLLLYTNGCAVANGLGQIMPNGDSINAGPFFDLAWLGDCSFGYPGRQDIMVLPDPGEESAYYIIHKTNELGEDMKFLKYTKVDLSLDNGLGDVTEKNVIFFAGAPLYSYLTAISHTNGRHYWIIQPKREDNVYYRFLLTADGIEKYDSIRSGYVFNNNADASGDAKFSPDGSKYAIYNTNDGLQVFDFDRATGELSNVTIFETEGIADSFSSIEFSSSSRFIYFLDNTNLWQLDLEDNTPQGSIVLIDQYNGTLDPFSTRFFLSALAPDCKIYIRGGSGANSMHVIKEPNRKGIACDFIQNAIRFPLITASGGFPNFPRFRVDEEEKCDPGLISSIESMGWEVKNLNIYPNPVSDLVHLTIPDQECGRVIVYDLQGQRVMDQEILLQGLSPNIIDVSTLASGSYVVEFIPDPDNNRHGTDRVFYQGRFQVVR